MQTLNSLQNIGLRFPVQVALVHGYLAPTSDKVSQYVDQWGAKRLTSLCVRRFRSGIFAFRDQRLEFAGLFSQLFCSARLNTKFLQDPSLQFLMDLMMEKWADAVGDGVEGGEAIAPPAAATGMALMDAAGMGGGPPPPPSAPAGEATGVAPEAAPAASTEPAAAGVAPEAAPATSTEPAAGDAAPEAAPATSTEPAAGDAAPEAAPAASAEPVAGDAAVPEHVVSSDPAVPMADVRASEVAAVAAPATDGLSEVTSDAEAATSFDTDEAQPEPRDVEFPTSLLSAAEAMVEASQEPEFAPSDPYENAPSDPYEDGLEPGQLASPEPGEEHAEGLLAHGAGAEEPADFGDSLFTIQDDDLAGLLLQQLGDGQEDDKEVARHLDAEFDAVASPSPRRDEPSIDMEEHPRSDIGVGSAEAVDVHGAETTPFPALESTSMRRTDAIANQAELLQRFQFLRRLVCQLCCTQGGYLGVLLIRPPRPVAGRSWMLNVLPVLCPTCRVSKLHSRHGKVTLSSKLCLFTSRGC